MSVLPLTIPTYKPKKAIIVIDMINEMIDEDYTLAKKGYAKFIKDNETISKLNAELNEFRKDRNISQVIFSHLAFNPEYGDVPRNSKLLSPAKERDILIEHTDSTEIYNGITQKATDKIITKTGISAINERMLQYLKSEDISTVYLAGVASGLAITASAFDLHDRGFEVKVIKDLCVDIDKETNDTALSTLERFVEITIQDQKDKTD